MSTLGTDELVFPEIERPVPDESLNIKLLGARYTKTKDEFKAEVVLQFLLATGVSEPSRIAQLHVDFGVAIETHDNLRVNVSPLIPQQAVCDQHDVWHIFTAGFEAHVEAPAGAGSAGGKISYQKGYTTVEGKLVEFLITFESEGDRPGSDGRTRAGTIKLFNKYKALVPRHYPVLLTVIKDRRAKETKESFPLQVKIFRGPSVVTWTNLLRNIVARYRNNDGDRKFTVDQDRDPDVVKSYTEEGSKLGLLRALDELGHKSAVVRWETKATGVLPKVPSAGDEPASKQ